MTLKNENILNPLSSEDYVVALNILKTSSKHIVQIADFFEKKILPRAKKRKNFLDIGAADGTLTKRLSPYFDKTTVVEPNPTLHDILKSRGFELIPCVFEKATLLENQKYDFILMSHLFYHMQQAKIEEEIRKAYFHLALGGSMLLVMMGPRGENHYLHSEVNPNYVHSGHLINALNHLGMSFEQFPVLNEFTTQSEKEMNTLIRFFTLDDCLPKNNLEHLSNEKKNKILNLIESQTKRCFNGKTYDLEQEEDYLLIKKTAEEF